MTGLSIETRRSGPTYMYLAARTAAADIAARRGQRAAERRALRDAQARTRAADALAETLARAAATLLDAALLIDGWHRANHGPWRKKRHGD